MQMILMLKRVWPGTWALLSLFVLVSCSSSAKRVNPQFPLIEPPAPGSSYLIRVGDVVQVDVFQEPLMTMRQRVLGDGTISVPLVGRVKVEGYSIKEAGTNIAARLNKSQLVNPQVTVTVLAYAPRRFTVWGQVKTPGTFVIPPEETVSLPEAIAMAGGNTVIGNTRRTVISRKMGDRVERLMVNAQSPEAQSFLISAGDIIHIPETIF